MLAFDVFVCYVCLSISSLVFLHVFRCVCVWVVFRCAENKWFDCMPKLFILFFLFPGNANNKHSTIFKLFYIQIKKYVQFFFIESRKKWHRDCSRILHFVMRSQFFHFYFHFFCLSMCVCQDITSLTNLHEKKLTSLSVVNDINFCSWIK